MTTKHPRKVWVGILLGAWLGLSASDANAQFNPPKRSASYNPYRGASTGGTYIPGLNQTRYSFNIWTGQITTQTPLGGNVYGSWPFVPGQYPITSMVPLGAGSYANVNPFGRHGVSIGFVYSAPLGGSGQSNNGYRSGGAYAYASPNVGRVAPAEPNAAPEKDNNAAGIVLADRQPAPVEQPRNAFNRWANDRNRQGQPDAVQRNDDDLNRNLTQPELKDVISGEALNSILEALIAMPEKLKKTAPVTIEDGTLKRLNFTRGTGSIGVLRDEGAIKWPLALQSLASIAMARQDIETRFADAYKQVADGGRADMAALDDLIKRVDQLKEQVAGDGKALTFSENVAAKRFLSSLEDSILFLKQPDAVEWLPGKCKLKPATVQEMVQIMSDKKIRFAPALIGNDQVNISTHLMLVRLYKQATLNR